MKTMNKYLSGKLSEILRQVCVMHEIKNAKFISAESLRYGQFAQLIVAARKCGCNWLWDKSEIYKEGDYFCLPSVDLNEFFTFEGNDSLKTHLKIVQKIDLSGVIWDTEYSAWYPKFKEKEDAVKCIEVIDGLFDKTWLKKLENIEGWR